MSSVTQKMGFESKLRGSSFFTDSSGNGFYDGDVNFQGILYKLGAVLLNSQREKNLIKGGKKIFGDLDFDYSLYVKDNDRRIDFSLVIDIYRLFRNTSENVWLYNDKSYFGKAILNTKIGPLDRKKMFLSYEGPKTFDLPNENIGGHILSDFLLNSYPSKAISVKVKSMGFSIYVPYANDNNTGSFSRPNWKYLQKNAAIILSGLDLEALLLIINLFENGFVDSSIILKLKKKLGTHVKRELLDNRSNISKKLILTTVPELYYNLLTTKELEKIYYSILSEIFVTGIDETIILNILSTISKKKDFNETKFLKRLLSHKVKGQIEFLRLYDKMNDWGGENNFSKIIILLFKIWYLSDFRNHDNKIYENYEVPTSIAYRQDKFAGFKVDNYDFEFNYLNADLYLTPEPGIDTGFKGIDFVINELVQEYFTATKKYHPFQPLNLTEIGEKKNEELLLDKSIPIPTFYLKAFDEKGSWDNFEKGAWLTFDVITTFTGIGNLAKLRYLLKAGDAARKFYIGLKLTYGIIEVASGVLSIALNFVDNCQDKKLCAALQQYLFWVEVATLGADFLSSKILKQQALETKEALKSYRKKVKNNKNSKEWHEFDRHLDEVINPNESQFNLLEKWDDLPVSNRGRKLGQRISKSQIKRIKNYLKKLGVDLEIHPEKSSLSIKGYYLPNGSPAIMPNAAAAMFITDGTNMKIVLRKGVTNYEFFHEYIHFRHSKQLTLKKYLSLGGRGTFGELEKELFVFEKLMQNKHLLTREEIKHAKSYINRVLNRFGKEPMTLNFQLDEIPAIRKEIKIDELLNIRL